MSKDEVQQAVTSLVNRLVEEKHQSLMLRASGAWSVEGKLELRSNKWINLHAHMAGRKNDGITLTWYVNGLGRTVHTGHEWGETLEASYATSDGRVFVGWPDGGITEEHEKAVSEGVAELLASAINCAGEQYV